MNRNFALFVLLIATITLFTTSCQKNINKSYPNSHKFIEQLNAITPGKGDGDITQQDIQNIIDILKDEILPSASNKVKDDANEIVKYLDGIKEKVPDYLEDEDNLIEACRVLMRINLLFAWINPNDFDANLHISTTYIYLATTIGGDRYSPEKLKRFNSEFNEKGVQAAKALVEKFPNNPMSYGQLAHATLYTGGDRNEVVRLLNKCLEIDKNTEYCQEFLDNMKDG